MAIPFSRSMRALEQDRFFGAGWILALGSVLLMAWVGWFVLAEIRLYEVSSEARVEVAASSHPVMAEVGGRVIANHLLLGEAVTEGQILIELEAESEALELEQERSRRTNVGTQIRELKQEIEAERQALESSDAAARLAVEEAQASFSQAESSWQFASKDYERVRQLAGEGLRSEQDLETAQLAAEQAAATRDLRQLGVRRLREEQSSERRRQLARIEGLERELSELEGDESAGEVAERRLGLAVDKRQVRAPVAGRLGEVVELRVGSYVRVGDELGTIVPDSDDLVVVAEYPPSKALGRIRQGQPARLRLDGYNWTEYGSVPTVVDRVGSETRDGRVRVQLAILPDPESTIPLDHGLPGTLEIEVERLSPAALVLRTVGRALARPMAAD